VRLIGTPLANFLIQPRNHGTAAAIAYSVTCLHAMASDAIVAFFLSDHHFENDNAFARVVEQRFFNAECNVDRVFLLGIMPDSREESYGWIEPGRGLRGRVSAFPKMLRETLPQMLRLSRRCGGR
jgi:mannose-1-phosphate guanylyltransferase